MVVRLAGSPGKIRLEDEWTAEKDRERDTAPTAGAWYVPVGEIDTFVFLISVPPTGSHTYVMTLLTPEIVPQWPGSPRHHTKTT